MIFIKKGKIDQLKEATETKGDKEKQVWQNKTAHNLKYWHICTQAFAMFFSIFT